MYACMYVCMYVCTYVCVYIYIHKDSGSVVSFRARAGAALGPRPVSTFKYINANRIGRMLMHKLQCPDMFKQT